MGLARVYLLECGAGLVLVDAGPPGCEQVVLRRMKSLGRDDLRLIFITHAHLDHYGSAAALRRITGASIAVHHADAEPMARGDTPLGVVRGWGHLVELIFPLLGQLLAAEPTPPDRVLEDGEGLGAYGLDATLVHTPGHTYGSSCLLVEGRMAFVGDLISNTWGLHTQRFFAQDWSLVPSSLARLQALRPERIYPGHGRHTLDGHTFQTLPLRW